MARPVTIPRSIHPLVQVLREEREQQGLSQRHVAQRMGNNSPESVSRIERGFNQPTLETLERMAKALGYDMQFNLEPLYLGADHD